MIYIKRKMIVRTQSPHLRQHLIITLRKCTTAKYLILSDELLRTAANAITLKDFRVVTAWKRINCTFYTATPEQFTQDSVRATNVINGRQPILNEICSKPVKNRDRHETPNNDWRARPTETNENLNSF